MKGKEEVAKREKESYREGRGQEKNQKGRQGESRKGHDMNEQD